MLSVIYDCVLYTPQPSYNSTITTLRSYVVGPEKNAYIILYKQIKCSISFSRGRLHYRKCINAEVCLDFIYLFFVRVGWKQPRKGIPDRWALFFLFRLLYASPSHPCGFCRVSIHIHTQTHIYTWVYDCWVLIPTGKQYISRYINRADLLRNITNRKRKKSHTTTMKMSIPDAKISKSKNTSKHNDKYCVKNKMKF